MAAILRSGKFLRIVSGLTKTGHQQQGPAHGSNSNTKENGPFISTNPSGQIQFHSLSLQQLQNALPVLSTEHEKKSPDEKPIRWQRRGSDPLLEFYVDKQKIEEAAKSIKVIDGNVGLNIVKELKDEDSGATILVTSIQSNNESRPREETKEKAQIVIESPQEKPTLEIIHEKEIESETQIILEKPKETIAEKRDEVADLNEQFSITPDELIPAVPMVPICEDPVSHQWYPLPVVCQMFRAQGRIYDLEALLWGSQGIRPEDRKCIYFWTLQAYADCGMFPQAVDLTRRLETEGLATEFPEYHSLMDTFAMSIYQQQQQQQALPTGSETSSSYEKSVTPVSTITSVETEESAAFQSQCSRKLKKAIANKDTEGCIVNFRNLDKTKELSVAESSTLIELFVKADYVDEAVEVTERMLVREAYPMPRIFRFLLNRLAARGQVEAMTRIGYYLTPKIKKEVSFDNRLCNGYLAAGRAAEYLNILIGELDEALRSGDMNEEKLQSLKDKFPRGGAMGLLESNPALVEPYTRLALKFVDLGYIAPVNVLWTYHFINGRHDLAKPLWDKHVRCCPQIMFQKVCQTARSTANVDLAERLVVLLEDAVVTNGARGIAYSCLLDVLTQNKHYSKGLNSLNECLQSGIKLDDINRTALKRLKEGLEMQGDDFPYEIPQKTTSSSVVAMDEEDSIRSATPSLMN